MFFLIASSIIGVAATAITAKTLVGYTTLKWWIKLLVTLAILFCWFGYSVLWYTRRYNWLSPTQYNIFSYCAYVGLGFAFILLALLLFRDFTWFAGYEITKLFKVRWYENLNPCNNHYLNIANVATVILTVMLTGWGMYEACKFPEIKTITIRDSKITKPLKIVQINDLHINRTTPVAKVENFVEKVNALKADVIVLVGDVVDELPDKIKSQVEALSKLDAQYGKYTVFGNHDFYAGLLPWLREFVHLHFGLLFNNGTAIDNAIYIAGIPDKSIHDSGVFGKIDVEKALSGNKNNLYTILLSHTPKFTDEPLKGVDLQLSGHTHGGQIFPFHFLAKLHNKYLAGLYQEDGYKVYVSRGAGYWGPPIRLFAPSDITVINLEPEE